jgi:hypothetical protein
MQQTRASRGYAKQFRETPGEPLEVQPGSATDAATPESPEMVTQGTPALRGVKFWFRNEHLRRSPSK